MVYSAIIVLEIQNQIYATSRRYFLLREAERAILLRKIALSASLSKEFRAVGSFIFESENRCGLLDFILKQKDARRAFRNSLLYYRLFLLILVAIVRPS